MPNPLHSGGYKPNESTVNKQQSLSRGFNGEYYRSTFPLSQRVLDTHQFADITPHFVFNGIAGDSLKITSRPAVKSHTLAAPLMQNLRMHQAYFAVPKKSILPNTFDYLKVPPKIGDDVDSTQVNCLLDLSKVLDLARLAVSDFSVFDPDPDVGTPDAYYFIAWIQTWFNFYSESSLIQRLGIATYDHSQYRSIVKDRFLDCYVMSSTEGSVTYHITGREFLSSILEMTDSDIEALSLTCPDDFVELFLKCFKTLGFNISYKYGDKSYTEDLDIVVDGVVDVSSWHRFISIVTHYTITSRDVEVVFSDVFLSAYSDSHPYVLAYGSRLLVALQTFFGFQLSSDSHISASLLDCFSTSVVNIERLVAYQLCCAQFFTNDNVDEVNTAEKWINRMRSLIESSDSFSVNNELILYDVFSRHNLDVAFTVTDDSFDENTYLMGRLPFIVNLMSPQLSMVYENYFLSAKTAPLAEDTVDLKGYPDGVDTGALATVRSILVTRFLNAVNSLPNSIREYCAKMFGVAPVETQSQPRFIGHKAVILGNQTVTNTADDQGSQETNLISDDNNISFSVDLSDDCIILGVTYYDLERCYIGVSDRFAFHYDRYDDFQPYLQRIGDQAIYLQELFPNKSNEFTPDSVTYNSFGYVPRFAEYKSLVSKAFGGFASNALKSWANSYSPVSYNYSVNDLLMRNQNRDIDRFFKSLTGVAPSSYFHFILCISNEVVASRPMEYKSNILMP